MNENHAHPDDPLVVGHETSDAEVGPLVRFAIFLAVTVLVISGLTIGLYNYFDRRENALKAPQYPLAEGLERPLPPAPRLQTYPFGDIQQLRREEQRLLHEYAWVDKGAGTVRIPIDRAIEVVAEKGLPHRPAPAAEPAQPAASAAPETAPPSAAGH